MVIKMSGINIDTVGYSDVDNMTTHIPLSLSLSTCPAVPSVCMCMYVYHFMRPTTAQRSAAPPRPPPIGRSSRSLDGPEGFEGREGREGR